MVPRAAAQSTVESQSLLWSGYFLKLRINDNYTVMQEVDERVYWFPWRQHQFILRTQVQRRLPKSWRVALGFNYFLQSLPHDPWAEDMTLQSEIRPQLEFGNKQTLSEKWEIDHRYRTDFRFFEVADRQFEFGMVRWRYRFQVSYRPIESIILKVFDEILLHAGPYVKMNIFDQNRIGAAVQYQPIPSVGIELSYFNLFQQRTSGIDFYSRHIVRFTIHHTIDLQKN